MSGEISSFGVDPRTLSPVTPIEPAATPDQLPKTVEANEKEMSKEQPEFSLHGWAYDQAALNRLTDTLEGKKPGVRSRLEQALKEGGGKAYGLIICELIAEEYRAEGRTVSVPAWKMIPNYAEQQVHIDDEFSTKQDRDSDGFRRSKVILRSSAPDEDWLSEKSGVLRSYADHHDLKQAGPLPEVPFVLQELVRGYGAVIDVGYSQLRHEIVVHAALGNQRGEDDFTSAVSDPEASVALFNEQGDSIIPARAYRGVRSFFKNGDQPHNDLLPGIAQKVRNLGIDFGIQIEAVIDRKDPNKVHIIQIRPTPERLRKSAVQNVDTSVESQAGQGEILVQTAITSGVFDITAEAKFHLENQIRELTDLGTPLTRLTENMRDHEYFAERARARGEATTHHEVELNELRAKLEAQTQTIPKEMAIGFFNAIRSGVDDERLDLYNTPRVYGGAYLSGYRVLINPEQITPATKHGSLSIVSPQMTEYLVGQCGMLSIPKEQIAAIQEKYASSTGAKLRVVSDGLVGQVILYT